MTPLAKVLLAGIKATGPMRVDEMMAACLLHDRFGYYATRDPLGQAGDFTTAPEISQMFGELIGLSLAQSWMDQGAPDGFVLAELGPGRGTLMADILRATRGVPGFHAALNAVHFVERSAPLRAAQAELLGRDDLIWHDDAQGLPQGPVWLVANEFFDALPIRQFERRSGGWSERLLGLSEEGQLQFGLGAPAPEDMLDHRLEDTREGDLVEHAPAASAVIAEISQRIAAHGGAAVLVDYGDWRSLGDTLQAVRAHEPEPVLAHPGEADLSAHVDFELLALAVTSGAACSRVTSQGVFLERLGITPRAQALAQTLTGEALDAHIAAHRRLTHPEEMGTLFKVMALYPDAAAPPPGLDP